MSKDKLHKNEGTSLADIFSYIWKKKILALIIFLSITLISFLSLFFINRSITKYVINFDYGTTPNLADGTYIDGSIFNYINIVNESNINSVKNSSEQYSNIDTIKVLKNIQITPNIIYSQQSSEQIIDLYYTISVNSSCFNSSEQARNFLIDLVNIPINKTNTIINNLDFNILEGLISTSRTYEDQIGYMQTQVSSIINGYEALINTFGDITVYIKEENGIYQINEESSNTSTSIKLSQLVSIFNANLNNYNYSYLEDIVKTNNYVKLDEDNSVDYYLTTYDQRKTALENQNVNIDKELTIIKGQIDDYLAKAPNLQDLNALSQLIEQRNKLELEYNDNEVLIEQIDNVINHINTQQTRGDEAFSEDIKFGLELDSICDYIITSTNTYTSIYQNLYSRLLEVNYREANIINTDGGIHIGINLTISVLLGLIISSMVAAIVGFNSQKKELGKEEEKQAE